MTVLVLALFGLPIAAFLARQVLLALPLRMRPALRPGALASVLTAFRIPWRLADSEVERLRALTFGDQSLEEFVSGGFGPFGRVGKLVRAGRVADARHLLETSDLAREGPSGKLADALVLQRASDGAGAEQILRGLLRDASIESRYRLWAASALREMGLQADEELADQLLGVIGETPMPLGLDTLAAYSDGSARYVNQSGAVILYDPADASLAAPVGAVGVAARSVYLSAPLAPGPGPSFAPEEFRFTFLTPRGRRMVSEDRRRFGNGTPYDGLFFALGALLSAVSEWAYPKKRA